VKPLSLIARIAALVGLATVLLLGAAAMLMDHLVDAEMLQRFDATLVSQAHTIAALVETGPGGLDTEDLRHEPSQVLLGDARAAYMIQCSGGKQIESRPAPSAHPVNWLSRSGATPAFADLQADGVLQRAVWFGFTPDQDGDVVRPQAGHGEAELSCHILLLQPRAQLDDILDTIDVILLLIPMLALLAVLALSPMLVRRGLRPLAMLGEWMRSIGPDAPGKRLQPGATRELQPLVARFNEVLARMDEAMMRERRFAGALAHETRTRLAELRALVDIERRHPSERTRHDVLDEVSDIGGELESTVTGLLLLTRLEAGIEQVRHQRIDLHGLMAQQLDGIAQAAARRNVRVDVNAPSEPVILAGDPSLLGIILGNLLRNAVAYTPAGIAVRVEWDAYGFRIVNRAAELGQDEVAQFGKRYWRQRHDDDNDQHAGLGLSLAGAAAAALGFALAFGLDDTGELEARLNWSIASQAAVDTDQK
jgi:signal transduction histidine kinase